MTQTAQEQAVQAASILGCEASELTNPFDISAIVSSKGFQPMKIVLYGVPGIGKTTFAGTFPSPVLLRTENGAAALDIPTFPKLITSLQDLDMAIAALRGDHQFKTLIIDSLDWLEPLVWQYVCTKEGKENIEDFGYGKGYVKVDDVWRAIQAKLEKLRTLRGMNIVTIAHAVPVTIDPPDSEPYQRYSLKLHRRGAALWMEWAEMILFLNYKARIVKKDGEKAKATGSGDRVIYTAERPAYQAKSRWPLEPEIFIGTDPTWAAFHESLNTATEGAYNNA